MGITKSEIFTEEQNKLANYFKVLGHPARIAILQICNDLVDELGLAQATISQHLKELKSVDIIQGSKQGKSVCYCINETIWNELQNVIHHFFEKPFKNEKCC